MDHTKRFMELLGNPDKNMGIIHVAGTNGKGSTCAYIHAILCSEGEKVGLFTSPHLEKMTERIRINGEEIREEIFVSTFAVVMKAVENLQEEGLPHPTFFEFLLGMGMWVFAKEGVTYAVLETGLGGRLDATNAFASPLATVITSIGLDHEAYLGHTIEEIASEKAGIIKHGIPVIYDGNDEKVVSVLEAKGKEKSSPCKKISDSAFEIVEKTEKYIAFYIKDAYDKTITWKIKNRGTYQVKNATLAIMTCMSLPKDFSQYHKWQKALQEVSWSGRMEEISKGIYIDGAHNVAAIEAVANDVKEVDVLLFSAVSDKNYKEMIRVLTKKISSFAYVVVKIDDERGVSAEELANLIGQETNRPIYVADTVDVAWRLLNEHKSEEGKALCLGSLYLVGMIKKNCMNKR